MKARNLVALCAVSSALLILVEAMAFGADVAASAQSVPQPMAASAGANQIGFGNRGNGRRRHKKHRRHRRGHHKRGMNRANGGGQGAWQNQWNDGSQGNMAGGGQRRRHRRHRGGRKRRMMQMNGSAPQGVQPGGMIGQ